MEYDDRTAAGKEHKKEMEELIRQKKRKRQNESTGVNGAISGGTLVEVRHFSVLWEEIEICQMGLVN